MPQVVVSERTGRTVEGVLKIGEDDEIKITYYPDRISAKMLKNIVHMGRLMDQPGSSENTMAVMDACEDAARFVVKIVKEWDLLKSRDPDIIAPLDMDEVSDFGIQFLFEIMIGLVGQVQMGEAIGTLSSTASSPMPSSRLRRSSGR